MQHTATTWDSTVGTAPQAAWVSAAVRREGAPVRVCRGQGPPVKLTFQQHTHDVLWPQRPSHPYLPLH